MSVFSAQHWEATIGLFSAIFGKHQKQTNTNAAFPQINSAFGGTLGQGAGGLSQVANILGVGPNPDQGSQGLSDFFNSSGGNFLLNQGLTNTDAFMRARGLGQSGAEMKALENYRQGLASTKLNDYLGNLFNLGSAGLQAGSLLGQTAKTTGKASATPSIASVVGSFLSMLSDRRAKTDIKRVGKTDGGLSVYLYRYKAGGPPHIGVMAQEVAKKQPAALGPKTDDGLMTVNYSEIA